MLGDFFSQGWFRGLGIGFGLFFGFYGLVVTWADMEGRGEAEAWGGHRPWLRRTAELARLLFQFWFNAVGGLVGWVAVWFLWKTPFEAYTWKHLLVVIVAFSGITGNLPHLSTSIRQAIVGLGGRIGGGSGGAG